ncbi:MAG: hypothetical protein JXA09_00150 [Anaerolineae bacterium]|nr:hypothetical protein [Anaerolineae bacterium]
MPLEVVMRDEIAAGIVAVATAMLTASAAHGATNVEYCRGVLDTVRAQALNHRIPWSDVQRELRTVLSHDGRDDLLDVIGLALPSG